MLRKIIISILLVSFLPMYLNSQSKEDADSILIRIEDGFRTGDAEKISQLLADNTHFSFTSDLSGYFSYAQTTNLLKDYFKTYKPLKFHFNSKSSLTSSPFAWGEYIFLKNGIRGSHKIFISLRKSNDRFIISQVSINK